MLSFVALALLAGCARSEITETLDAGADVAFDAPDAGDAGSPLVTRADKIDLLFVVDNSRNVEVSQDLLAKSVPYLFERLTRPACVNGLGNVVAQTESEDEPCPVGQRDIARITDIHVGVLSTSLGGHGADLCSAKSSTFDPIQDDKGRLLARDINNFPVATYEEKGFLAWDPSQSLSPPGDDDLAKMLGRLDQMVRGVGLGGCGFESQLETMYRFLVDPEPYAEIPIIDGSAQPQGLDEVVLQQRKDFLRADSAVVIVLVTDENDCSVREGGQYFLSLQASVPGGGGGAFHLPRARSECEENPNDVCCFSCGQAPPEGCGPNANDPNCAKGAFSDEEDPINLRCFDQKRRYGVDFLYPVDRYVQALSEPTITDRAGQLVANPLFSEVRDERLVVLTGIVGVPWQDLALDSKDLSKGYKTPSQIDWSLVLGDPATLTPPLDPLMIESIDPREGTNPVLGAPLAPPESPPFANPINGHERFIAKRDDLQYACIYPRVTFKACNATTPDCECKESEFNTNPLCQTPDGSFTNIQRFTKGLPGVRQLRVLQGLGEQAVTASICSTSVQDFSQPTFGYKPSFDALMRTLRPRLIAPTGEGP